jgi:HEAT repeat protein
MCRAMVAAVCLAAGLASLSVARAGEPFWNLRPLGYWLNQLRVGDAAARAQAARGVKEIAAAHGSASVVAAVPLLVPCLDAPDALLRFAAADALGPIGAGAEAAGPRLLLLFERDPDAAVRRAAGAAVGRIRPGSIDLVAAAGRVLERDVDADVRVTAAAVLIEAGPAAQLATGAVRAGLSDDDPMVRVYSAAVIGRLGNRAIAAPVLLDGLTRPEAPVRIESAGLLADTTPLDARTVPALIAALGDDEREVRVAAADALATIGRPAQAALAPLWRLIRDPDEDVREHALRALRVIKG